MKRLLVLLACIVGLVQGLSAQVAIRAGQAIEIRIGGVPSTEQTMVNNTYPVSEDGTIRMPLIGTVRAAGLSPQSLAQNIESAYKSADIYTHPSIQVLASSDEKLNQLMVTVGGQVRNPGPVEYIRGLTLYNAVQAARGATEFGAMGRVALVRNGQRKEYDLKNTKFMNIQVEPGDTIEVPQKNWLGQ
ncbi:polysaccharide biosynthesis/export family protein [Haloferula sp. BvORR071]|uniref:polysaccharide biosynthesis/export family protein n=1 Tax=Haloferula sp. BvORR071 TaxID=1396141 RepID=UPI0009DCFD64|nr:polysaccharide biosynthesis/export family protein [Haloferula sp. BvORR071]